MITKTIILESPLIAKIPKTDKTHKTSKTEPTACSGRGKMLNAHPTTARISSSHKVTGWLLILNKTTFGMLIPEIGAYPRNQRIIRMTTIAIIILFF